MKTNISNPIMPPEEEKGETEKNSEEISMFSVLYDKLTAISCSIA